MTIMADVSIFILAVGLLNYVYTADTDGYSVLFNDNKDAFTDKPIEFEYPLPKWLKGSLIRIGPAQFGMRMRNFTHAFDGFGKLYSWKFYGNGSASFSTRFLGTEMYNVSNERNDIDNYMTFTSVEPPFSLIKREEAVLRGFDNTNVNIYGLGGTEEYIALTDAWKVYKFDPVSLNTLEPVNPQKPKGADVGFIDQMSSAHPLPEYNTSHHFTFITSLSTLGGDSRISVMRIKSAYERELVAHWSVDRAPYMHSFSVTSKYVILFASAYFIDKPDLFKYGTAYDGLKWYPNENAHIYVVEIKSGKVHTFKVPNAYPSHHVNAYEEKDLVIMDIVMHNSPNFSRILDLKTVRSTSLRKNVSYSQAFINRYTIDMLHENVSISGFESDPLYPYINAFETPSINEKYRHKKYCYVYGVANKIDSKSFSKTALVKKDVCGHNQEGIWSEDDHYPIEMWFIPSPNATQEDDGVLLTPVYNADNKKSYLLMLDGITMAQINKAHLPSIVPFTIHGRFFPGIM